MLSESKLEKEAASASAPVEIPTAAFPIQVVKSDPVEVRTTVPSMITKPKRQEDYIPFEYGNSPSMSSSQFTWTTSTQRAEYISTLSKQLGTSVLLQTNKVDLQADEVAALTQSMRGIYIPNEFPQGEDTSIPGINTFSTSMAGEERKNAKKDEDTAKDSS